MQTQTQTQVQTTQTSNVDRNVSYGLMAVIFGVVPVVNIVALILGVPPLRLQPDSSPIPSISPWALSLSPYALFVAGILGVVTGLNRVWGGKLAKLYDLLFGIVFALIGLVVVVVLGYVVLLNQDRASTSTADILFPALIAMYFGLSAVYRGVQKVGE